jgi:HemY protein
MRALIWIVLLFALAVGFSLAGKFDTGYAVLVYPPYRIELSLTLFVIVFLLLLVVGHLFFRLASATLRLPETVRAYRAQQRIEAAREMLDGASRALWEAHYADAEKQARALLLIEPGNWRAMLIAARAAHAQKAYAQRDAYLAQAEQQPEAALAVRVARTECLLDMHQSEAALAEIERIRQLESSHPALMALTLRAQAAPES